MTVFEAWLLLGAAALLSIPLAELATHPPKWLFQTVRPKVGEMPFAPWEKRPLMWLSRHAIEDLHRFNFRGHPRDWAFTIRLPSWHWTESADPMRAARILGWHQWHVTVVYTRMQGWRWFSHLEAEPGAWRESWTNMLMAAGRRSRKGEVRRVGEILDELTAPGGELRKVIRIGGRDG